MRETTELLRLSPVIPVVTLEDPGSAADVARALLAGGIGVLELTLRTGNAVESMRRISREVPQMRLGAGTVLSARQVDEAVEAGAGFLVSPGTTPELLDHMTSTGLPLLPGVATVSEAMVLAERGLEAMKFFPAGPAGGPSYLKALGAPLPRLTFCPTGGVSAETAPDYLALPNVACVGGSWLTPSDAVRSGDWERITRLAAEAARLAT